jgi:hypothetical protein
VPLDLRPVFERAAFGAAGHVRRGKARIAAFVSVSPVLFEDIHDAANIALLFRACPPTQQAAWDGSLFAELAELRARGRGSPELAMVELAFSAGKPAPELDAIAPSLSFAGEGMKRYVSFHEEIDTEYWASFRHPLFNPCFEEAGPPTLDPSPGVEKDGEVRSLQPAVEQEGEAKPGAANQRPTFTRVQ